MAELLQNVSYALRQMRKAPGFAAVAAITLALGIGMNTAMFSVIEAVMLRPLPYPNSDRLVLLADVQDVDNGGVLYQDYEPLKTRSTTLQDSAIYYRDSGFSRVTLSDGTEPESVQAGFVSSNFFPLMGVPPELGRTFTTADVTEHTRVVVLSHGLWTRKFGASSDVIGEALRINGVVSQVIGVMPETFQFPASDQQFWAPLTTNPYWGDPALTKLDSQNSRGFYARWQIVARLKPGMSLEQARTEIGVLFDQLKSVDHDPNHGVGINVIPLQIKLNPNTRLTLFIFFAAVVFVLLIACTNVANLILARGVTRQREIALRASLGASRGRLMRQFLTESAVLALISGAMGLFLAYCGLYFALAWAPAGIPRLQETRLDERVFFFTLIVSLLAALFFGALPAWKTMRSAGNSEFGDHHMSQPRQSRSIHGVLIVAEFALTVVLLTGAGLLLRSFLSLEQVTLGFEPAHVLTLQIATPAAPVSTRNTDYNTIIERARALPGVRAVGAIDGLFETGKLQNHGLRAIAGRAPETAEQLTPLQWNSIRGDFFPAMGIRLLKGRYFTEQDGPHSPLVAIIDESMARRYWPEQNPLGMRFKGQDTRGQNDDWITVVGVVSDTRRSGLERNPVAHVYEPYTQAIDGDRTPVLVVRSTAGTADIAAALRSLVRELEPEAILSPVVSLDEQLADQVSPRRFQTVLLGLFSVFSLLLACLGIYGVLLYSVTQRIHEIGIRMALGARKEEVLRLVLGEGAKFALVGLAIGTVVAAIATRFMASLLFGITAADPLTFSMTAILLTIAALAACYFPARRASKVDPMVALRYE